MYTAAKHSRENYDALKNRLRQGETVELGECVAEWLGGRESRDVYRELADDLTARIRYDRANTAWLIERA